MCAVAIGSRENSVDHSTCSPAWLARVYLAPHLQGQSVGYQPYCLLQYVPPKAQVGAMASSNASSAVSFGGNGGAGTSEVGSAVSVEVTAVVPQTNGPTNYGKARANSCPRSLRGPAAVQVSHLRPLRPEITHAADGPAADLDRYPRGTTFGSKGLGEQATCPAKGVGEIVLSGTEAEHVVEGIGVVTTHPETGLGVIVAGPSPSGVAAGDGSPRELVMLASRTGIRKAIKMGLWPPSLEMLSFPGGGQMGADQAVWQGRPRGHHHIYTQDEGPTTSTNTCIIMKAA